MDEGDLEEGITWEELFQALEDKTEVKVKQFPPSWKDLILMLLRENSFFSLRKIPGGGFSMIQEKTSKRVLDSFLKNAWNVQILRSRND
jgi:hypothetical protein